MFSTAAFADYKIAVFDLQAAVKATTDGKKAIASLDKEFKSIEKELKSRESKLRDKFSTFEKKAMILSEAKRMEQQRELQQLSQALQKDMYEMQMKFQQKQLATTKPIIDKLQAKLTQLAKQESIDVILNKSTNGVLWSKDALNITDKIVKMYEAG